ncbi:hypothetical protein OIV83_003410 [Microbotryomycetes sp. JL201]|nr:hypothetical protein OIV83_003410 [Microbotryomycetes sp. JL201]
MSAEHPPPSGLAPGGGLQDKLSSVLEPLGIAPKPQTPPDMTGKVTLITGGPLGIGYEIARAFLKAGAKVILVNRKQDQGDLAIKQLKEELGNENAPITWIGCDLGNLQETKEVFDKVAKDESRLDVLVCSAGINTNTFGLDSDGIDRHFGVNWLGHFLAINRVYPLMRKTSKDSKEPPRIVFEASEMHKMAPKEVHFSSLDEINNDQLKPAELYGRTKLAMILGAKGLRDYVIRPNNDHIFAVSVHPGTVNTEMQHQWSSYGALGKYILCPAMFFVGRSPEQGSYSGIYAATSPEIVEKNWNGFYFDDAEHLGSETDQAQDEQLQKNLWTLSTTLIQEKLGKDSLKSWQAEP